ncbi:hydrogenase 4 membrane subunit [Thermoanaerobacter sp. YS13]|uniref:hydrogenase 4 membrane subunit n=1 Tax=Thermoanaerobacter sp. YS13 TaxID=1511746 RepID=UPI000574034B|nr:hydrogenase 4 membrane subunit [Thermoanaerobacter sp. YS13]KHO62861.1 hydrogenase 4 membrane subunit [Thermoanaerobacter sp. YS13]
MSGTNIVNVLSVLLILTSMLVVETRKLGMAAYMYRFQSLVLVTIFLSIAVFMEAKPLYIWSITALITKTFLVPYLILKFLKRVKEQEEGVAIDRKLTIILAVGILALSFAVVEPFHMQAVLKLRVALAVSIAHFMLGLLCILARKNALKQILGYCLMENGSHLTLAIMAYNAPETVEIGILTDAVFAVLIMTIIARRLFKDFGTLDTDKLTLLKG